MPLLLSIPSISLTDFDKYEYNNNKSQLLMNGLSEARYGFVALPGVKMELYAIKKTMGGNFLQDKTYTLNRL